MRKYFLFQLLLFFCIQNITAQTVAGRVMDSNGNGVGNVSVQEKPAGAGTSTDSTGNFVLNVKSLNATLTFSSVGYNSQDVALAGRANITVVLNANVGDLNEVVVVGYGTQKKSNLSGAVYKVDEKVLASRPIANVSQGLQGAVPNLNIQFNSGSPGEAADINIRGITSINGGAPLILIDGVPSSSADLNRIATQDIANISVIKDASASAIYGARASFGVILITTKEGTGRGVNINYTNNFSFNKQTVVPAKITDPYIFSRLLELSTDNTPWDNVNYSDQFYKYAKERSDDPSIPGVREDLSNPGMWEYMGNQDWTKYFMKDGFMTQNHDLSISGRSNDTKINYFLSAGYNQQKSPLALAKDAFDRYNFRSKVNYKVFDWLKVGNNTFFTNTKRLRPASFSLFDTYNLFPTDFDKNPDGSWANTWVGRMAAQVVDGGRVDDDVSTIQSTFSAEASFFNNLLKLNTDYTFQRMTNNYSSFNTKYNIGFGPNDIREEGNSYAYKWAGFGNYKLFNIYATANKRFNLHDVTLLVGYSAEDYRFENFEAQKNNLISSTFPVLPLATGEATANANVNSYAILGSFYRFNYIYNNKYIFELNGRYDGSSRFPKDKRYGFFPSASVAWRVNQENFLQNASFLSDLKLRFSYGSLGNQNVSNYGYLPTMAVYQSYYLAGGQRPYAIGAPGLVSSNYTWEKVNTSNAGIDFGFFNNKLNGTFDYYVRNTLNMLTKGKDLPDVLGAPEPNENAADLKTKGWELSLGYRGNKNISSSPFNFEARLMLSDARTHITRFDNPTKSILQYYEGMEMGEIWGLENDGLFKDTKEIEQLDETAIIPWGALSIVPGWPKYKDLDKDGKIDKGYTLGETKDLRIIGNNNPRYRFGLDLTGDWKGFDARIFFQGIGKRDYYPLDYLYWGPYQQPYGNFYEHLLDFYRPENSSEVDMAKHSKSFIAAGLAKQNLNAEYPILQSWLADRNLGTRIDESMGLAIPQTKYLLNAAYLRIKNVTLGYTIPASVFGKSGIKGIRLFASAENLAEWSQVKKYFDPESVNTNIYNNPASSPARSGNGMVYPFLRTYAAGINVNL